MRLTSTEILPDEILLIIFEYLHGSDLLEAFYGLNSRLNYLLYVQYRSYCFNFHSVPKRTFDTICQQHLPFIADQMIALALDNDHHTPEEFNSCCISGSKDEYQIILDNVWALPKLTHCTFGIFLRNGLEYFCVPQTTSTSIESFSVFMENKIRPYQLEHLFEHTPHLRRLSMWIELDADEHHLPTTFPTVTELKVFISECHHVWQRDSFFLQRFTNLYCLDMITWSVLIDGYQWEEIIRNYMPNLQVFRLQMQISPFQMANIQEQIDELMDSFRGAFWVEEHRWFIRCFRGKAMICLYRSSKEVIYSENILPDLFQSTYPRDEQEQISNILTNIHDENFFDQPIPIDIRLHHIQSLRIKMPINDRFWSIVPSLNELKSLQIVSHADQYQEQLQFLFNRTHHLHRLTICQDEPTCFCHSIFQCYCPSIDDLCFRYYIRECNHYFNADDCALLTHSTLGAQCHVLSICVTSRHSIVYLIENLHNLYSLTVECRDEKSFHTPASIDSDDEIIPWLKGRLPSTCMIRRHPIVLTTVQIWI